MVCSPSSSTPPKAYSAPVFDFSNTVLADTYTGYYVKVIDDVYTSEECAELIALAESTSAKESISPFSDPSSAIRSEPSNVDSKGWQQAAVSSGLGKDFVATEYRNSKRILRFDFEAAEKIYERLKPLVEEIHHIYPGDHWEGVVGTKGYLDKKWEMVGVNERLSFLKYEPGNYFREHCDGLPRLPDGRRAFVTLQIYLGDDGVKGGATRIIGNKGKYIDVEPKKGRVLIFQHRNLFHSGEDVTRGIKYALRSDFMFREVE